MNPTQTPVSLKAPIQAPAVEASTSQAILMTPKQIRELVNTAIASAFTSMGING